MPKQVLTNPAALCILLTAALYGCFSTNAAEPFDFSKEREWEFLNQAKFHGKLVKIEDGKAYIQLSDGIVREFWPGMADGLSGSFLQRAMAKLPSNPTRPNIQPGSGPLIDLTASELATGALGQWKNAGRLGGAFSVMNQPPVVAQIHGRKAVIFEHAPWLLPLEYQTLVSDFYMPESAIAGEPLTVIAWICNTGPAVERETFLCWGEKDCGELDSPDFSYGCYDAMQWYDERVSFPQVRFPKLNQWHQLAFVVMPFEKDKIHREIKIYCDGEWISAKSVRKPAAKLLANNLVFLGCAWEAWWGHKWATRPARPFTGAIAGLQVYDRSLSLDDLRKLNSPYATNVTFTTTKSVNSAINPEPANEVLEVQSGIERLSWTPSPNSFSQVLHFGPDREAVTKGTASTAKLKGSVDTAYIPLDLKLAKLDCGKTYFWRIESLGEAKQVLSTGETWSFTTSEFALEFDGPVSEKFPAEVNQNGFYERYMEVDGTPIISPPGNDDIHLRAARRALHKLLDKRPDLVTALRSQNAGTHLASEEHRGFGWSEFTCSSYGRGEAILREGAILMHEMGHQFHMQGAEQMEPDFRHRLGDAFNAARRERLWMGDYGGSNMWENVAVCASWWINDMAQDEGDSRPRELLRRSDPRIYHLLAAYWPGDVMIDLHPSAGMSCDTASHVLEWRNGGGIEYFKPNSGWKFYERSTGVFSSSAEKPRLGTAGGVSSVIFAGRDALVWDKTTWDALDGNRAWAVEMWVYRDAQPVGDQSLLTWGTPTNPGAKFLWGESDQAALFPGGVSSKWTHKPEPGRWHHLVWVFTGGGYEDGPGELQIYVDGKLDSAARMKQVLPAQSRVTIAPNFTGALGHVRVYNNDLHPLQIETLYKRELPAFSVESPAVAGRLLVDFDARILGPCRDTETWPLYPASLNKAWLRSWINGGTLGGKLHNDARSHEASQPLSVTARGAQSIAFDGKSRMISDFIHAPPSDGTAEFWVLPEDDAKDATLMQWGTWSIGSGSLRLGEWQHLAVTLEKGVATTYLNGVRAASETPISPLDGNANRLILGSSGDGKSWNRGFHGKLARVRIHDGLLKPEQIAKNAMLRPSVSNSSLTSTVSPARKLVLDFDAADLQPGPVTKWSNKGSAGGSFVAATERDVWRPLVEKMDGRNGVDFTGRKALLSSLSAPAALLGGASFSVSIWGYCQDTSGLAREQIVLSWGRRSSSHAEFCWGSNPKSGAFIGGPKIEFGYAGPEASIDRFGHNAPLLNGWRHIAYTYNDATKKLRVYVDGKMNREESVALAINPGEPICLGGMRGGKSLDAPFSGMLGEVAITDSLLSDTDIARLAQGVAANSVQKIWLVRLDAAELIPGAVSSWPNRGSLGGEFAPEAEDLKAPRCDKIDGRAAVTFDGEKNVLISDFKTPPTLTADHPLTVEMRLQNPKLADIETLFTLAPSVALKSYLNDCNNRAAFFNFGAAKDNGSDKRPGLFSTGIKCRNVGWKQAPLATPLWQQVVYVYSGGYKGTFSVYVDGKPVAQQGFFSLDTMPGYSMFLGAAWNTSRGASNFFSGALSRLRVYDYAKTEDEIRAEFDASK